MRRLILILGVVGVALTGCGKPDPTHDAAFFRANADARRAELLECSTSAATATTPECLAAAKAAGEAESHRSLPYQAPASRLKNAGHL